MTEAAVKDFYLTINGSAASTAQIAAASEVIAESTLNQPSMALITFFDPDLTIADDSKFTPGKTLKIEVETTSSKATVFDGEIVEVELDMRDGVAYTTVRAFDKMHRLTRGTKVQTFLNVKDSDVVSKLVSPHGLSADVTATRQVYPYILQQAESDLDMIRRLAARNGYFIGVKDGKLQFKPLKAVGTAKNLTWGDNLYEFRPRLAGSKQLAKVSVRSWDVKKKAAIVGVASREGVSPKIGEKTTSWSLPRAEMLVADVTLPTQVAAEARAGGLLNQHAGTLVEAEGVAAGDATLMAGASVKVEKVGTRFAGTYIVTSSRHRFTREDGYSVTFNISGLGTDDLFDGVLDDVPLAGFSGLMPAIVTNVSDPDDLGRVKVKLPWLGDTIESDWARVAAPGVGATRGLQFPPEVNDEVLVGFLQGSGDQLFVLGGLWNGTDGPPRKKEKFLKAGKIIERVIRTRVGHEIALNDDSQDGGIIIKDSKGNEISIKVKEDLITIKTTGEVQVTGGKGITLSSDKDITIKAGGTLSLTSTGDMSLEGKAKLSLSAQTEASLKAAAGKTAIEGLTVDIKGKTGAAIDGGGKFEIKGAMGNISGSGVLELKGGIIKLN